MIVPSDLAKESVHYDLKKRPSEYVAATYRLCIKRQMASTTNEQTKEGGEAKGGGSVKFRDFCFAPLHTSCIPKHVKIHTEILAQILVPHKEAVLARKNAPTRNHYNDWVWNKVLARKKVDRKLRKGFRFHHHGRRICIDPLLTSQAQI